VGENVAHQGGGRATEGRKAALGDLLQFAFWIRLEANSADGIYINALQRLMPKPGQKPVGLPLKKPTHEWARLIDRARILLIS
jgi:hypothetical protein